MERVPLGAIAVGAVALPVLLVMGLREPGGTPMRLPVLPQVATQAAPTKLAPPTVTTICMTDDTELLSAGDHAMLCWANGACEEPRPAPAPPAVVVSSLEVRGGDELWHGTRRVTLPAAKPAGWEREGAIEGLDLIGDHAIVVRAWDPDTIPPPPKPPSRGTIVDTRGHVTAVIAIAPEQPLLSLGDDAFLAFDGAGAFTLIVGGRAKIYGELAEWHTTDAGATLATAPGLSRLEGRVAEIHAVVLAGEPAREDDDITGELLGTLRIANVAASWCDEDSCHVTNLMIGFNTDLHGVQRQWIDRSENRTLPRC